MCAYLSYTDPNSPFTKEIGGDLNWIAPYHPFCGQNLLRRETAKMHFPYEDAKYVNLEYTCDKQQALFIVANFLAKRPANKLPSVGFDGD